jgi:hypothetical protein
MLPKYQMSVAFVRAVRRAPMTQRTIASSAGMSAPSLSNYMAGMPFCREQVRRKMIRLAEIVRLPLHRAFIKARVSAATSD